LKYDWVSNKVQLTTAVTNTTGSGGNEFSAMTLASGVTAPELAKALIIYPDEPGGDYAGDYHWINSSGERLPIAGGYWINGSHAGVFSLSLLGPRSHSNSNVGFRSAFVEL
jgi:hypothetical protein